MMWENRSVAGGLRQTCVWGSLSLCSHLFYLQSSNLYHPSHIFTEPCNAKLMNHLKGFQKYFNTGMSVTAIESRTNTVWITWFLTKKPSLDMPPFFSRALPSLLMCERNIAGLSASPLPRGGKMCCHLH